MLRAIRIVSLTILTLSIGCRVVDRPAVRHVHDGPVVEPDVETPQAGGRGADASLSAEPGGAVILRDVLSLAVSRHPKLAVYPHEFRAADARALQAGLRRNPELEIAIEEFAGRGDRSGFDGAETTVRIDQPVELGGKRARRARAAGFDTELVEWDYRSARLDVVREATDAFTAALAAQERVALSRKLVELSQQAYAAVAQRVEAGRDPPVDELRASVELSTSRIELQKAEKRLAAARHGLAAVWGGRTARFDAVAGDLYEIPRPIVPDDAIVAIVANPDVARWETQEKKQRAVLSLEKANAIPDVTVGGGVQRFEETDDSAMVLAVGVPIPLFDRNQGGIREAVAELAKTRRQSEAVQVRTLAALAEAVNAQAAAYDEVTVLRDDVLPKAQQAFAAADNGYRQGKFDYLYVLDTQRMLFETQAGYIDAAQAYHQAQAGVRRLIGELPTDMNDSLSHEGANPLLQENPK